MNINDYVESPDIAAHCQRIGHEFSPLDIAVLVDLCDKPLKEKLTLWRTIIEECPDMPVHQSIWFSARESLHAYLRELIVWHEKALPTINKPGSHAAYRSKHIHAIREQMGRLSDIFIHIPVPFVKGDLIEMSDGAPGVLLFVPHWLTGEPWVSKCSAYSDRVAGRCGDGTDMCASYYQMDEGGRLFRDHDRPKTLHSMRCYKKEPPSPAKFLQYVSDFLHAPADERDERLDWLISAFCLYRADALKTSEERFLKNFLPLVEEQGGRSE